MLAYVFWHWPYPHVEETAYQKRITNFHKALRTQRPKGFQYSVVLKVEHAPWSGRDGDMYEEWYVVENSAALDTLNEAAISGPCKEPHNQIAKDAAGGAGGLYRLCAGEPGLTTVRMALWFAKPPGMTYETLYGRLQSEIEQAAGSVWQRQMTLGPAPEFCWHSPQNHRLPEIFDCSSIPVTQIWS